MLLKAIYVDVDVDVESTFLLLCHVPLDLGTRTYVGILRNYF